MEVGTCRHCLSHDDRQSKQDRTRNGHAFERFFPRDLLLPARPHSQKYLQHPKVALPKENKYSKDVSGGGKEILVSSHISQYIWLSFLPGRRDGERDQEQFTGKN